MVFSGINRHFFLRYIRNTSVHPATNDPTHGQRVRSRQRTIRVVGCMTLAFFISWSPYAVVSLAGTVLGHESIAPSFSLIPELLAKASVVYNPILYVLLNSKFRVTLLQVFSWSRVNVTSSGNVGIEQDATDTGTIEIQPRNRSLHRDM